MGIRKIIKQTLNEVAGISFEVREWAQILSNEIGRLVGEADIILDDNSEDDTNGGLQMFTRWRRKPKADIKQLIIEGRDFPEAYEKFSVDKWVFNDANRIEYDHNQSGYDDNGEYVVIFNVPIRGLDIRMFVHETKHAYDDWNRLRNGGKPIKDSWEIKNIYTKDFEKLILGASSQYPQLMGIIRSYYLASKLETPAYLENEFDSPKIGSYKMVSKKLMDFNISSYYNKKGDLARGLEDEFTDMLIKYDIPLFRKFRSVDDFLVYTEKYFHKRGRHIMKKIDKMLYIHGNNERYPTKNEI
jgi:hypothetical protein